MLSEPTRHTNPVPAQEQQIKPGRSRAFVGTVLLLFATVAVLAAGVWGVVSSLGAEAPAARIGEMVEVPGGQFSVDRFAPEHMAPMKMGGFAKQGMNMAMPQNMDMTPKGMERLTVDFTLIAGDGGDLAYSPEDFRIGGESMNETGPYRSRFGTGTVPVGSAFSGTMTFQVPKEADNLTLSFDDGRSVALNLEPGKGGASEEGGEDHGAEH